MYQGPERRRYSLFVTRNTEYHLRDRRCVAVRRRPTGEWLDAHPAMGKRLEGGLKFTRSGSLDMRPSMPAPGDVLFFTDGSVDSTLLTSALLEKSRPSKETVAQYPA